MEKTVRLEVKNGVAYVVDCPEDVIVEINDLDEDRGYRTYRAGDEIITNRAY